MEKVSPIILPVEREPIVDDSHSWLWQDDPNVRQKIFMFCVF